MATYALLTTCRRSPFFLASRLERSVLALAGLYIMGTLWASHIVFARLIDAQALLLPFCYSLADCYIDKYWPVGMGMLEIAAGDTIMACGLLGLLLLVYPQTIPLVSTVVPEKPWPMVGLIASTLVSLLFFYSLINHFGAVFVSAAVYVALFMGIIFGVVLFDEALSAHFWVVLAILLLGLVIIEYGNRWRASARESGHKFCAGWFCKYARKV